MRPLHIPQFRRLHSTATTNRGVMKMNAYTRSVMFLIASALVSLSTTTFAQVVHEEHVVIDYAAPGSDPMRVRSITFTIPADGNYQAVVFPERPNVVIKGIEVPVDVAIGYMTRDASGAWRQRQWQHGTGNSFVNLRGMHRGTQVRIWFSSSIGGLPSPRIGGMVRILRTM